VPCLQSVWYGSQARKYSYDIKLNKISDRARTIITTVKSIAKVAAGPLFGVDASGIKVDEIGNFVKADIVVKDDDTAADINLKTASGERSIKDYALRMSGWSKRLRSLLFSNPAERLFGMGVIKACTATRASVATMDAFSFKYALPKCWTLVSGHCSASPSYAVFARQTGGKMSVKVYIGGHSVEFDGSSIKVNGSPVSIPGDRDFLHKQGREEIFRITKWGSTYNVYSYLKVWIMFDGNFVTTIPAPSVRGQHCGLCGNYNRNKWDEMTGKDGHTVMTSVDAFVNEYKWKC